MTPLRSGNWLRFALPLGVLFGFSEAGHASSDAHALEDRIATVMSWVVLIVVPIIGIVLFLLVHVLPEKIAKQRHHPQKDAIHMLCLLSLVFGGLLWPLAWLWTYTRPTGYKRAFGTDKHESYFVWMAGRAEAGELEADELAHLQSEFASIEAAGQLNPTLRRARDRIFPQGAALAVGGVA